VRYRERVMLDEAGEWTVLEPYHVRGRVATFRLEGA
jgi:hypothetical protein